MRQYYLDIYQKVIKVENCDMPKDIDDQKIQQNRRLRLAQLINDRFGGIQAGLVDALDANQGEISSLLKTKAFGEKKARSIERTLELEKGWLDKIPSAFPEDNEANESITPYNAGSEQRLPTGKWVAIVGIGKGGPDGYISIDDFTQGDGDGYIYTYSPDPSAYGIRVRGDSMRPRIKSGEYIVAEPSIEASPGDDVVVRLINGNALVKELLWIRDGEISLGSINNGIPPITIPIEEIANMHRVAAIIPRGSALIKARS